VTVAHRLGCAALERRAACTCGAARGGIAWGYVLVAVLLVGVLAVWAVVR